ncbi:TetR/AcrR family transcriptional regulator C-terminal domain-containing protein [Nonomuraea africana]|uniref:AcrR family transcriptional regulator n=1 Tax=Nonomuraea africana TaxID=46171 RepID=A0ABR9K603_9ACTN|nr:TetR/AcrR family transcriptional regulator C-terminal domain-containing protein [Nonomuraea africana]MBE1557231.1 AcrR family transcriptional regulator [Nonomuraea africana]
MTAKQFTSVWTREPRQGKTQGLTRDQIVRAALEILDAEGLDALSMRKLGAKLGAGATSLYWHVANKEELLELAFDEIWGEMSIPDPGSAGWRDTGWAFAHGMRKVILRHPWVAGLIGRMPAIGPNSLRAAELLRKGLHQAGFRGLEEDYAGAAITAFVFGSVIPEVAWFSAAAEKEYDAESMREIIRTAAADYPELVARAEEYTARDPAAVREMNFAFGLACVLDGLERRLVT